MPLTFARMLTSRLQRRRWWMVRCTMPGRCVLVVEACVGVRRYPDGTLMCSVGPMVPVVLFHRAHLRAPVHLPAVPG